MSLKEIIDQILRDKRKSLSWLANNMGKTFDGLRLGLINESIKYKDLLLLAEILNVSPCIFFDVPEDEPDNAQANLADELVSELDDALKSCKELTATLKDQLKDKERIISLLNEKMA